MEKIKVFLADSQQLILAGFRSILSLKKEFEIVGEAENRDDMCEQLKKSSPDVLVLDFTAENFDMDCIRKVVSKHPKVKILAITPVNSKSLIQGALKNGVTSYLLKSCDKNEIYDALKATQKGEKFFCSKVLDALMNEPDLATHDKQLNLNCEGLSISEREIEIIILIAEGNSNKEIADKLFLSPHTVNTHRKNIMSKLGVSNATGIVLFAVKEQLISPNKFLFSNGN